MKIFVARHGETEWNALDKVCGRTDVSLTEKGHNQAKELAQKLLESQAQNKIQHIFVSPLLRARQTSSYIEEALGITATVEPNLIEINFGSCEGMNLHSEEFNKAKEEPFVRFPDGESYMELSFRAKSVIKKIRESCNGSALLVCHGAFGRAIASCFIDFTIEQFKNTRMKNCEVYEFEIP